MDRVVNKINKILNPPRVVRLDIGGVAIGKACPKFFIAELGINHNGRIELAKQLIDVAADAGAQAVKFQKRTIPVVYTEEELAKPRVVDKDVLRNAVKRGVLSDDAVRRLESSDFEDSTNGDLKWALEFTEDEYRELFDYATSRGLISLASPWDEESVDVLERLGVPCHKIASASLTDHSLLHKVRSTSKPILLSTGMSTMDEILRAVNVLGTDNLVIIHTVSTYPSKYEELNLKQISAFRDRFPNVLIGYSGHEEGTVASLAASVLGVALIERHLTLDKNMFGSDQKASMEPHEFKKLISEVRLFETAFGSAIREVLESEIPIREKLRRK